MMTMEMLRKIAPQDGLAALLHERPFAGVNGSGKHNNWSLSDEFGNNLLGPGDTPHDNVQFLVFCAAVIRAVDKWQGLLRVSIAHAGNDHRLGANEAPPAIISIFLGDMLTDIFEQIEKNGGAKTTKKGEDLTKAVGKLLTKMIKEHKRIIFNGNGYSEAWQKDAAKRKLLNHKNTVDALPELVKPEVIKLLDRFKILNEREVRARYEIFLENYNKTINIEGQLAVLMANRYILPAALEYQKRIGQSVTAVKQAGASSTQGKKLLSQYTKLTDQFKA